MTTLITRRPPSSSARQREQDLLLAMPIGAVLSVGKAATVIEFDALEAIEGRWFVHGQQEVQLGRQLMSIEVDSVIEAGLPVVRRLQRVAAHVVEGPNGRQRVDAHTQELFYRATVAPAGTAAGRIAREGARKVKKVKPFAPVTIDPAPLAAQPERVHSFAQGPLPVAAITPAAPAIRGREPVMAWLSQRVALKVVNGHVLASTRGGRLPTDVGQVLNAYGPRLLGPWLSGQDVPCDVCGAPAVAAAALDAVLCAPHCDGGNPS